MIVRAEFDLEPSRADELIRIVDGRTTIEQVRSTKAAKKRVSRSERSAIRIIVWNDVCAVALTAWELLILCYPRKFSGRLRALLTPADTE